MPVCLLAPGAENHGTNAALGDGKVRDHYRDVIAWIKVKWYLPWSNWAEALLLLPDPIPTVKPL